MYRVLIVEDDTSVREALKLIVEAEGHEAVEAADGEIALAVLKDDPPDVVLLDYRLPNIDGIELLREIRGDPDLTGLPVIMVTAKGTPKDRLAAMKLGVLDYINKPWAEGEIESRLRWALKKGSMVPAAPWETAGALSLVPANLPAQDEEGPELDIVGASKDWSALDLPAGSGTDIVTPGGGGHVETEDGRVQVTVPKGAVRRSMTLSVSPTDDDSEPHPASLRVKLGNVVSDLTFSDTTGFPVEGVRLDEPIEIAIGYDGELAENADGELQMEEYDSRSGEWITQPTELDPECNVARISKSRFPPPSARQDGGKVLIVTDDRTQMELLHETLNAAGYQVNLESHWTNVANRVATGHPHVVILDFAVNQFSGLRILRQLKNDPDTLRVPVIVLGEGELPGAGSKSERNDYADSMSLGARDMLVKPWHPGELQMRVDRAFDALMARNDRAERKVDPAPIESRSRPAVAAVTDAPVTDASVTDAPGTDRTVTDAPATDAPGTDTTVTDAPATDAPVFGEVNWERVGKLMRGWKSFKASPFRRNAPDGGSSDRDQ